MQKKEPAKTDAEPAKAGEEGAAAMDVDGAAEEDEKVTMD